ncbi:PEP-CTERM sorting domain-containing protein [Tolypothrix sp. PCC 7910]|uniref:PEP-CTERM sorting domain-containing protein n=1 Tax=Tolypothrix sp. PCC 7910 TaxID=2099387 RepID=UPI0014277613|nr:PEP-CTERM sorting domain-containing protein [Tolypothrix sp. PCC 7910]QIR38141.1 PEP-CTERM sorting domain-containing protein [Tolypothrix sp. PCC 7910]
MTSATLLKKLSIATAGAVFIGMGMGGTAKAAQVGDTVNVDYLFPTQNSIYDSRTLTVTNDGSSSANFFGAFDLTVAPRSFLAHFQGFVGSFTPADFNGFIVKGLSGSNGLDKVKNVVFKTNFVDFDASRLSHTDDSISVNWQNLSFQPGTYLKVDWNSPSQSVPEPLTLGGTVLAGGIGLLMKKRKAASHQAKA